jgi:hypothetical protein
MANDSCALVEKDNNEQSRTKDESRESITVGKKFVKIILTRDGWVRYTTWLMITQEKLSCDLFLMGG